MNGLKPSARGGGVVNRVSDAGRDPVVDRVKGVAAFKSDDPRGGVLFDNGTPLIEAENNDFRCFRAVKIWPAAVLGGKFVEQESN